MLIKKPNKIAIINPKMPLYWMIAKEIINAVKLPHVPGAGRK